MKWTRSFITRTPLVAVVGPATFVKLAANIALNSRASVVEAFQSAVTGSDGFVPFSCEIAHNVSAIADAETPRTTQVRGVSLDSLIGDLVAETPVAGIKLDAEGHELAALEGSSHLIRAHWPWLIVEFNTTLLPSKVLEDWPIYCFLSSLGYQPFVHAPPLQETEIDRRFTVDGYRNILFQRA